MDYIQSTNTCMCISCVPCVCEMHAHAFALHLCIGTNTCRTQRLQMHMKTWYAHHGRYTIHKYMHVYIMCALRVCVCEMHAHACALHLCIALLCVHLVAWGRSQQALLQNVKNPWAPW